MLKKISLQKQLIVIFTVLLVGVLLVLFPLIDSNLTRIIDNDMYDVLDRSQDDFYNYNFTSEANDQSKQIYHLTYDASISMLYPSGDMTTLKAKKLATVFSNDLLEMIDEGKSKLKAKGKYNGEDVYYQIEQTSNNTYIISIMYSDYSKSLVTSFRQEIVNIFYIAFLVVGIVVFLWVSSLIKPLKQITRYINDIKEDKESILNIERSDEIGVVSNSLVEMKDELEKQDRIKEEMIHNISHDLKTPIALIKTYTQSIKDGIYPYGDKDASLDVILENSDRLDKKVRSLLYLNRLDYISGQSNNDICDMRTLIEHIVIQLHTMHPEITIDTNLDYVNFKGNEDYWRICIENIIDNAYRFVKSKIVITLKDDYIEIYNDGDHIENDDPQALFQPYETGTKGQFGLGLSIVYKTVTMYGYDVKAINQEVGVSFIITSGTN